MPGKPPAPRPCASPCIFSLTLTLTSKNFATQRSRQTDSPLLRSASRYEASMHFLLQDWTSLIIASALPYDWDRWGMDYPVHQTKSAAWPSWHEEDGWDLGGSGTYRAYISETMSISASAWAIFCSDDSCGWRPKRNDILAVCGWQSV